MLGEYYDYIRCHQGTNYLHWNMRDVGYGFNAIDNRYKVLGGTPDVVVDERKFDLLRIFIEIYGVAYTGHPRLETILELNEIKALDFLSGKQEADAFDAKEYHSLHRSTLRKIDVLGNLASRSNDDQLSTKTSWWQLHGGHYRLVLEWLADNKLITLVMTVVGLILAVLTLK